MTILKPFALALPFTPGNALAAPNAFCGTLTIHAALTCRAYLSTAFLATPAVVTAFSARPSLKCPVE